MFSIKKILHYLIVMEGWGFKAKDVLAGSGLHPKDVSSGNDLIDTYQYEKIVFNMLKLTGDDALGLKLGSQFSLPDMGAVGFAMLSAPTMREVLSLTTSYANSIFGPAVEVEFKPGSSKWYADISILLPVGPAYRFCLEEYMMLSRSTGAYVSNSPAKFSNIELIIPQPEYHEIYYDRLSCSIQFNSKRNRLTVISPLINDPVISDNVDVNELYLKFCDDIARRLFGGGTTAAKVQHLFLRSPRCLPSIVNIAEQMRISERTLRRKLKREDVSYRELVNRFRCELAKEYLKATDFSIMEIGYLLGYKDSKPFLRAFKSWTGETVGQFRAKRKY